MNDIQQQIEALLFYQNQPRSYAWLARSLNVSLGTIRDAVELMLPWYEQRGITLVIVNDEVTLVTHPHQASLINTIKEQEAAKELSKQSLETLAIILFKKFVTKPEIDFIRGVNSSYTLRALLVRGLIDKKVNPNDRRSPLYFPTMDLLSFLGITKLEELPGYHELSKQLVQVHEQFIQETQVDEHQEKDHQETESGDVEPEETFEE